MQIALKAEAFYADIHQIFFYFESAESLFQQLYQDINFQFSSMFYPLKFTDILLAHSSTISEKAYFLVFDSDIEDVSVNVCLRVKSSCDMMTVLNQRWVYLKLVFEMFFEKRKIFGLF